MEVSYKTDVYASYLRIRIPEEADRGQYAFQMLEENCFGRILPARERVEEGIRHLYLEITGKKNLLQEYMDREMKLEEMGGILGGLIEVYDELREYLLPDKLILTLPEFLYLDRETGTLFAALLPWEEGEGGGFHALAEFFLEKMNPRDEHGVNLAYLFYRHQGQPNFSLYQFLPLMEKETILKRKEKRGRETYQETQVKLPDRISREDYPLREGAPKEEAGWEAGEENLNASNNDKGRKKTGKKEKGEKKAETKRAKKEKKEKGREKVEGLLGRLFGRVEKKKKEEAPEFALWKEEGQESLPTGHYGGCQETAFFEEEESLKLEWKERGRTRSVLLKDLPLTVGKIRDEVNVIVDDPSVSQIHCRFINHEGGTAIVDMNSTNGTLLNGMELRPGERIGITKNDEICLGKVRAFVV